MTRHTSFADLARSFPRYKVVGTLVKHNVRMKSRDLMKLTYESEQDAEKAVNRAIMSGVITLRPNEEVSFVAVPR